MDELDRDRDFLAVVRAVARQRRRVELEILERTDRRLEADADQLVEQLLRVREIRATGVVVPSELRADLDSPVIMQEYLWDHISPELLANIETRMYVYACNQVATYWASDHE